MTIVICRPTDQLLVRDKKFARTYQSLGLEVVHLGNRRNMIHLPDGIAARTVYAGFAYRYSSWTVPVGTLCYQLATVAHLRRLKPDYVHAGDFEGLLGAVIYKKWFATGCRVIYDIADSYAARYRIPQAIEDAIQYIDDVAMARCDVVILPQSNRYGNFRFRRPVEWRIVPNCPFRADAPIPRPVAKTGDLRVLASGWIRETRGIRQLVEAAKASGGVRIVVVQSGNADTQLLEYLQSASVVEYRSTMPQSEVLQLAQGCHLVAAMYEPSSRINRQAAPNKVYDAMASARPVLINSEVDAASEMVDELGCGFAVPYYDIQAMTDLFAMLKGDLCICDSIGMRGRRLFEEKFHWEAMEGPIKEILGLS